MPNKPFITSQVDGQQASRKHEAEVQDDNYNDQQVAMIRKVLENNESPQN